MRTDQLKKMSFSKVYPFYIQKALKKERTKDEVDQIVYWLTGYNEIELKNVIDKNIDFETFFNDAPNLNSNRSLITGLICGIRVEDISDECIKNIRYLDKLIDELAKGKSLDKIFRKQQK